jgi:hypothetical protein
MMNDRKIFAENMHLLSTLWPTTLIQNIDHIRELRTVADEQEARDSYDPEGHTANLCRVFRERANEVECAMERRIGWA